MQDVSNADRLELKKIGKIIAEIAAMIARTTKTSANEIPLFFKFHLKVHFN